MKTFKVWILTLGIVLAMLLTACNADTGDTGETTQSGEEAPAQTVTLVGEGAPEFKVLRGDTCPDKETDAAVALRKALIAATGVEPAIGTDWVKRGEEPPTDTYEILVGNTNRPETADALSRLGENQYIIKLYGENRLVLVGSHVTGTTEAVDVFIATYLSSQGSALTLPADYEVIADISYVILEDLSMYKNAMKIDDLYGKLTVDEVKAFTGYVEANFKPARNNDGNAMIYGETGGTLEVLNLIYKQTGYTRMLPVMCKIADAMMAARNDQENGAKTEYLMGGVQPAWSSGNFVGVEIGDIAGHILFVAENILNTPEVWDVEIPDGDPYGYGKTYKERAVKYVELCDQILRDYLMKYFINDEYRAFEDSGITKSNSKVSNCTDKFHPWNRQFMMVGGFVHGAKCHRILKDNDALADEYDKVVQALVDFFVSQLRTTTVNGEKCYVWNYWPAVSNYQNSLGKTCSQTGGKIEDANDAHMAYDVYGMYICHLYGYDTVTDEVMQRFCNTLNNLIYDPDHAAGVFRGSVNGQTGKADKNWMWPQIITLGIYDEESYKILFSTSTMNGGLDRNIQRLGRALYTKSLLYGITPEVEALQ